MDCGRSLPIHFQEGTFAMPIRCLVASLVGLTWATFPPQLARGQHPVAAPAAQGVAQLIPATPPAAPVPAPQAEPLPLGSVPPTSDGLPPVPVAVEAGVPVTRSVTLAEIEKLKQQVTSSEPIAAEKKAEILDYCEKAIGKLADAEKAASATTVLQQELADAARDLEALTVKPADPKPLESKAPDPVAEPTADEMRSQLVAADQRVSAAREKAQKVAAEIERRATRRQALPELLAKSREQLAGVEAALKEQNPGDSPLLAEAKRLYQLSRRVFRENEIQWLEQENRTYEATSRLWLARRDAAEKQLQLANQEHQVVHDLAAKVQRREAELQAREARRAAVNAHPAVKEAAAKNAEFAEQNQKLVAKTQRVQQRLAEARDLGQTMKARLKDITKRAAAAKYSPTIGALLRSQQDQLPPLGAMRERLRTRPVEISQLGFDVFEWEVDRREALHADVAAMVGKIEAGSGEAILEATAEELRRVYEVRANILAELISNANDCMSRMEELETAEAEVVATTRQLASFVAEQVLWVRSAPTLSWHDLDYLKRFWGDVSSRTEQTRYLAATLVGDLQQKPGWWFLAGTLLVGLVAFRGRVRRVLRESGQAAAKPTATSFRPTIDASLATVFMALPLPLICGFLGWRLCQVEEGLAPAVGWALALFAAAYGMLNLVRHASRSGGLGTNHFNWDVKGLAAIRRAARAVEMIALPLLAISVAVEIVRDEASVNAIGRLSLISALIVIGVCCVRLFRPTSPLTVALTSRAAKSDGLRWIKLVAPVVGAIVLGFIVASVAGYHYTAMQLTRRLLVSSLVVFGCLALRSLLMRWLLVAYRRVAMQHARQKRKALLESQGANSSDTAAVETTPQLCLGDINLQARKLVNVGALVAFLTSLWLIWGDVLPALGVLNRIELWQSGLTSGDPDAGPVYVLLTDVIQAVVLFAFTWIAGRNLPGLLEIAVLQKLPLDAGARYAASSMTRYAIMVVGVALGLRQLGIGWNSVQWLIAAMTVGLGFGLQEIFANFVSGIILLFERPARVGDTVTIGNITGTVTKIRIRATTIVDWDNRELIVPNKEFVTGNLVNWTLTSPNLRLILKVGVAYGSDTRRVTQLLYQVAHEDPNVLESPEPVVVFDAFGDSSLNFELRVFVNDLSMYRRLKHDLHLRIDDLFREHQVEIAFPQCDLHIRSVPVAGGVMPEALTTGGQRQQPPDPQQHAA
jgi:potassium efflux system protein